MRNWRFMVPLLVGLLSAAMVMSCAEERDPINRVQPNVIKKAMLNGEWVFHQKVTDVPGGMLQGFWIPSVVGWYSEPLRVRFEIQENFLYVRRINELVEDAETYSQEWDDDFASYAVIAAYRIQSHFDIQRDYNSVTGESYNVVSENMYDRPWWEREYMRVDWSQNLAPGFEFDVQFVATAPAPYYVQDSCTPDLEFASRAEDRCIPDKKAPFFDIVWNEDGSALEQGYFDITNMFIATPGTEYLEGYGELPSCWLFGNDAEECVPTMYFVRNSFWKRDFDNNDYEPLPYSGAISDQFGYFYHDFLTYDQQTTIVEPGRKYFADRFNIWEQSHSWADDEGIDWSMGDDYLFNADNARLCHTTADCCPGYNPDNPTAEAGCLSICDIYTDLRPADRDEYEARHECQFHVTPQNQVDGCAPTFYCTLPYNARRVRPIVYYNNAEWPEEVTRNPKEPLYQPPTADAPGQWSYLVEHTPDAASQMAWNWAMADEEEGEERSMMEQVADRWNAPYVRTINILKNKHAGTYNASAHANTPQIDDDMPTRAGGTGAFSSIGLIEKDADGVPQGTKGFDEKWYDPERPPFAICRFSPVLGPDYDPNNVEPDICWERIQENSHCVFNPDKPGVNPKTGDRWDEAAEWPICSFREAAPRLGDIRYSMAYWVDKWYEGFRLLGLGPGNSDSVNGETYSGSAHMYMHNDMAARRIVDNVMLITGDLDPQDYLDGYNLVSWNNKWTGAGTNPTAEHMFQGYTAAQINSMGSMMASNMKANRKLNLNMDTLAAQSGGDGLPAHGPETIENGGQQLLPWTIEDMIVAGRSELAATPQVDPDAMIKSIASHPEGASIEANLLQSLESDPTLLVANGLNPFTELTDDVKNQILITRGNPFKLAQARESVRDWIIEDKVGDFAFSTGDDVNTALAYEVQRLRAQNKLPQTSDETFKNALWRLLRKKVLAAVTPHEIGHSVGLRHNFAGSEDVINYREGYWETRANGCADTEYDYLAPGMDEITDENPWDEENGCGNANPRVGPRFVAPEDGGDPISRYELYKKMYHDAYSSVMDYNPYYHVDDKGIGRYEWAAILFGYGHQFEVYTEYPTEADGLTPQEWQLHKAYRPGRVTEESTSTTPPAACVINDASGLFSIDAGLETGTSKVIDKATRQTGTLASIVSSSQITIEPGSVEGCETAPSQCFCGPGALETDPPVDRPLAANDAYSVWGWPIGFNTGSIGGNGIDQIMEGYMTSGGAPIFLYYVYFVSPHYTEWYRNWTNADGVPDAGFNKQANRDVRDIREFDWRVRSELNNWEPGFNVWDPADPVIRVPYAYCTDNQRDISNNCRTRDTGADDWERMHYHIQSWDQWYIGRSFIRSRVGYRPDDYASGYYDRIYRVPKEYNDIYSLYIELLQGFYGERELEAMMTDPWNSWGGYTMALHDGFNMLMQTLAAPDAMNEYTARPRPQTGEFALDQPGNGISMGTFNFDIAQGGRVFETRYGNYNYDNVCGNSFWRCLWNVGYYYDKVMAINGLSEAGTYFVGRDTSHDIRLYRVSFFDNFNWQLKKYFAGLMGENWEAWAPMVIGAEEANDVGLDDPLTMILPSGMRHPMLFWRDWANPANDITRPEVYREDPRLSDTIVGLLDSDDPLNTHWTPIDPVTGFTVQVYAMVLGMARFQHNYDISFYNASRMWSNAGSAVLSEGNYSYYYDLETNVTYVALSDYGVSNVMHPFTTDEDLGTGVAASMIEFANKMKSRSSECDPFEAPETSWDDDDCCDNPYDPVDADMGNDCEPNPGDVLADIYTWTDEERAAANEEFLNRRAEVDNYLKRYKGLLDFQVRLTNIYDYYTGFVGPWDDPGDTPAE